MAVARRPWPLLSVAWVTRVSRATKGPVPSVAVAAHHAHAGADHVVRRQGEEERADERAGLFLRKRGALGGRGRHAVGDLLAPADKAGLSELLGSCHAMAVPSGGSAQRRRAANRRPFRSAGG